MCQVRNSIPHLGFGQSKDYVYAGSRLVAELDWGDSVEPVRYVATDHLGSTRYRIKPDGTAVGEIEYYPFGAFRTGGPSPETTHLFTGHERDLGETSSQLDYMHARYYSFNLGRFLSVDPVQGEVGSGQSWNRYSYSGNNPVIRVDFDGRVDQTGFDAYNRIPAPKPAERTPAQQKRDARILGITTSAVLAYYTGGSSLLGNVITGTISNIVGGGVTRGADGDPTTQVADVGKITIDGLAGAGSGVVATGSGWLLNEGGEAVSGLTAGVSRIAAEGTSNATAIALGSAIADAADALPMEGPNPRASDPTVNCHLIPSIENDLDANMEQKPLVSSH